MNVQPMPLIRFGQGGWGTGHWLWGGGGTNISGQVMCCLIVT